MTDWGLGAPLGHQSCGVIGDARTECKDDPYLARARPSTCCHVEG